MAESEELDEVGIVLREARKVIAKFNQEQRVYKVGMNSYTTGSDAYPEIAVVGIYVKSIKGKKIPAGQDVFPKECEKIEKELSLELTRRLKDIPARISFIPPTPY